MKTTSLLFRLCIFSPTKLIPLTPARNLHRQLLAKPVVEVGTENLKTDAVGGRGKGSTPDLRKKLKLAIGPFLLLVTRRCTPRVMARPLGQGVRIRNHRLILS